MCEEPVWNRGNLRVPSKKELCKQFRGREIPGNCKKCDKVKCGYNHD